MAGNFGFRSGAARRHDTQLASHSLHIWTQTPRSCQYKTPSQPLSPGMSP